MITDKSIKFTFTEPPADIILEGTKTIKQSKAGGNKEYF